MICFWDEIGLAPRRHVAEIEAPGGHFAEGSLIGRPPLASVVESLVVDLLAFHRQTGAEMLFDAFNLDLGGRG